MKHAIRMTLYRGSTPVQVEVSRDEDGEFLFSTTDGSGGFVSLTTNEMKKLIQDYKAKAGKVAGEAFRQGAARLGESGSSYIEEKLNPATLGSKAMGLAALAGLLGVGWAAYAAGASGKK